MTQTFKQREAIKKYCEVQRSARSEFRANAKMHDFSFAPPKRTIEYTPFAWADSYPFLIAMATFAGFVWVLRAKGYI